MKTYIKIFILLAVQSAALNGCKQAGKDLQPGILLSFDDRNMMHWEKQIPLFAKYDANVTFFIHRFDELTEEELTALRNLKNAGHTIGCHGLRHIKAAEYSEKYSTSQYMSEEIFPAIKVMTEKGFPPSSFAYPSSNNNDDTDRVLLEYFRYIRTGCGIEGEMIKTERAFKKIADIRDKIRFDAMSFHPKSPVDTLVIQIKDAMDRIKERGEIFAVNSHDLRNEGEEGPRHYITVDALEETLAYAQAHGIKFYSYDELP